ncbi:MAG: hypothetical protein QM765_31410 [Myxococcales bacterium]
MRPMLKLSDLFYQLRKAGSPAAVKKLLKQLDTVEDADPLHAAATKGALLARLGQLDEAAEALAPVVAAAKKKAIGLDQLTNFHPTDGSFWWCPAEAENAKAFSGKRKPGSRDLSFIAEYFCATEKPAKAAQVASEVLGLDEAVVHFHLGMAAAKKDPMAAEEHLTKAMQQAEANRDYTLYTKVSAQLAGVQVKDPKKVLATVTAAAEVARNCPGNFPNHKLSNFDERLRNVKGLAAMLKTPPFQKALERVPEDD